MAKQDPSETVSNEVLEKPITVAQMMELISKMNEKSAQTLADALIESKKPYIDPKVEENDKIFREQNRRMKESEREMLKANQSSCPHIAGSSSLSEYPDMYGRTSIVWHEVDSTEVIGICTTCLREFREVDEDYAEWRRKPSINRLSRSGQRQWGDATAAKQRARG